MKFQFAHYGHQALINILLICIILLGLAHLIQDSWYQRWSIAVILWFVCFIIYFFRDPDRLVPQQEDVIVSPADGKVTHIETITEDKYIQSNAIRVSIFLSPFDVHVNRIPYQGTVEYIHYFPGAHHIALYKKSSSKNEHSEFGLMTQHGKVMFRQIAGIVARRIVHELSIGDEVQTGDRFGMILFGSRMDVIVMPHRQCKVKKGQRVKAGQTILFVAPTKSISDIQDYSNMKIKSDCF